MDLLKKIEPDNIENNILNKPIINKIIKSIQNKINIILKGPYGSGKTIILKLIYNKFQNNSFFINQSISINEIEHFCNSIKNNKLLIIDDIEIYDKKIINTIKTYKNITILASSDVKFISNKIFTDIYIDYPKYNELCLFLKSYDIIINEDIYNKSCGCIRNIILNYNTLTYNEFLNKTDNDIVKIIINGSYNFKNLNSIHNINEIFTHIYDNIKCDLKSFRLLNKLTLNFSIIENFIIKNLDWNTSMYFDIQKLKILIFKVIKIKSVYKCKKYTKVKKKTCTVEDLFLYDKNLINDKFNSIYDKYYR